MSEAFKAQSSLQSQSPWLSQSQSQSQSRWQSRWQSRSQSQSRWQSRSRAWTRAPLAFAVAAALAACKPSPPPPSGRQLWSGPARGLVATPAGDAVAWLAAPAPSKERGVPEDVRVGKLFVSNVSGGAPRELGDGVTSLDGSYAFSPDGKRLAFLAKWRFADGRGELWSAAAAAGAAVKLCDDASSFAFSPEEAPSGASRSRLGAICDSALRVGPGDAAETFAVASQPAREFEWALHGLVVRGPASLGGRLGLVSFDSRPGTETLAERTDDFALGRGGSGLAWVTGTEVEALAVGCPKGARFTADRYPNHATPAPGGEGAAFLVPEAANPSLADLFAFEGCDKVAPLGKAVGEFAYAASGHLAFVDGYDGRARAGTLRVHTARSEAAPKGATLELGKHVQEFHWSPSGKWLTYLVRNAKGGFTIELWASGPWAAGKAPPPHKVDDGVYGYSLSPDEGRVYYKARCADARSCTILVVPSDGSNKPVEVAKKAAGFELSRDGRRVVVLAPHRGSETQVDLKATPANGGDVTPLASACEPIARLLGAAGESVAFVSDDKVHAGVWVAPLP